MVAPTPVLSEAERLSLAQGHIAKRQFLAGAELLDPLIQDGPGPLEAALLGRVYFNASLQAARSGQCGRAHELAGTAARFNDSGKTPSNLEWKGILARYRDCRDPFLQMVLKDLSYK